jgi:hypothetical protein
MVSFAHRGETRPERTGRATRAIITLRRLLRSATVWSLALLLFSGGIILLSGGTARAQPQNDPARFCQVKAWTGTFTIKGTGRGQLGDTRVTIRQSENGSVTLDQGGCLIPNQLPARWTGSGSAWVSINDEGKKACPSESERAESSLLFKCGDRTTSSLGPLFEPKSVLLLNPTNGTYVLSFGAGVETQAISTSCHGETSSSRTPLLSWGPANEHGLGLNTGSIPLPASGLMLSGSIRFQKPAGTFPAPEVPVDWELTWNLSPTASPTPIERVDKPCLDEQASCRSVLKSVLTQLWCNPECV